VPEAPNDAPEPALAPTATRARFPVTPFVPGKLMVPPAERPRLVALMVAPPVAVMFPAVRRARLFDFAEEIEIAALTVMFPLVESPTRMVPAVMLSSSASLKDRVSSVSFVIPRFKVRPAVKPVIEVTAEPEVMVPVIAALSALIAVLWFPAALLIAAELVNLPFELIVIEPFAVVAVSEVETVTSPPEIVIGPAIDVALPEVIAAVLVLEPRVSALEVDEMVTFAVEIAALKESTPTGGSMVLAPVPASSSRVRVGCSA
jgi:hypothetical protein